MNLDNLVLRPNCLLTRYPIVFIGPPRSLFYFELFGSLVQGYIRVHGYDNQYPILPFRSKANRVQALKQWFSENSQKSYHLVLAKQTQAEFASVLSEIQVASITFSDDFYQEGLRLSLFRRFIYLIHTFLCRLENVTAVDYKATFPSTDKTTCDRFLDHCIKLAENDHV